MNPSKVEELASSIDINGYQYVQGYITVVRVTDLEGRVISEMSEEGNHRMAALKKLNKTSIMCLVACPPPGNILRIFKDLLFAGYKPTVSELMCLVSMANILRETAYVASAVNNLHTFRVAWKALGKDRQAPMNDETRDAINELTVCFLILGFFMLISLQNYVFCEESVKKLYKQWNRERKTGNNGEAIMAQIQELSSDKTHPNRQVHNIFNIFNHTTDEVLDYLEDLEAKANLSKTNSPCSNKMLMVTEWKNCPQSDVKVLYYCGRVTVI